LGVFSRIFAHRPYLVDILQGVFLFGFALYLPWVRLIE
jgi:hypothetical protein